METEGVTEVLEELEQELAARGKSAKRHIDAYNRDIARIRELLPAVRAAAHRKYGSAARKKYGPGNLEDMISGVIERGTISRLTAEAAGTSRRANARTS